MGLYDNFKQSDTPYMSQYVGSIVPELADYAKTVQNRYNQAADTDDNLTEAMNNLQHLGFSADTQYANELKQKYYQRLQDRSATGDYENMGRRTKRDAMNFSAEYQPLIQRQNDFAIVAKRVNADPNITDPEKKAQILEYIKNLNTTAVDPLTGDFVRDPSGKVMLNGIQDWSYAKDVDINKKLTDLLSKREAEIKQGQFHSDGSGLMISSIDKLRDPKVMRQLADEMMNSDPEIHAMLKRDVTLQNYKLKPDEVAASLKPLDVSPYQRAKQKGLSDHDITVQAKAAGMSHTELKTSVLAKQQANLIAQGMTPDAANKVLLDNLTLQQLKSPHSDLVGSLLGIKQHTLEARSDDMLMEKMRERATKELSNQNFEFMPTTTSVISQEDPIKSIQNFTTSAAQLKQQSQSLQSSILAGLKIAGVSTGDTKKDLSISTAMLHNKAQLFELRDKLKATNPELAQRIETAANQYTTTAAAVQNQANHVAGIEQASGIDMDKLYQQYRTGKVPGAAINHVDSKLLSKEDFMAAVRNPDDENSGFIHNMLHNNIGFLKARRAYQDMVAKGFPNTVEGKAQAQGYHVMEPTGSGRVNDITDMLENTALNGGLQVTDLNDPSKGSQDPLDMLGIDRSKGDKATRLAEKGVSIRFNAESVNGKPTLTIRGSDGKQRIVQADNLPPNLQDELSVIAIEKGAAANTGEYAHIVAKQGLMSLGSSRMTDITPQYLKLVNPGASGVTKSINSNYDVRVKDAGDGNKKYELFVKDVDGNSRSTGIKFDSVDDLTAAIGKSTYNELASDNLKKKLNP